MRKAQQVPALEGDTVDAMDAASHWLPVEEISMEESHLMWETALEAAAFVNSELAETDRVLEITDALEELACVASAVKNASDTELRLMEIAGDMAAAGSDVPPERIVPAMESYLGTAISVEGIKETAKTIWENIQKFLKKIWENIQKFFTSIFSGLPYLYQAIDRLEKKVKTLSGDVKEKTITLTVGLSNLCVGGKSITNDKDILTAASKLNVASQWTFGSYSDSIVKRGEVIAKALHDFDVSKYEECSEQLRNSLHDARSVNALPGAGQPNSTRYPGFTSTAGTSLPGNVHLTCKYFEANKDVSVIGTLDRYRNSLCELTPEVSTTVPEKIEFETLSLAAAEQLLKQLKEMITSVNTFKTGGKLQAIEGMQKTIEAASEKAQNHFSVQKEIFGNEHNIAVVLTGGRVNPHEIMNHYRAVLNFNQAYARWTQTPAIPMTRHVVSVVKAMMTVVQKSLDQYEVKAA